MNLGLSVRGRSSREYCGDIEGTAFAVGNKAAICSVIDLVIAIFAGEKLSDVFDGVGVESEQFITQHKRPMLASGSLSLPLVGPHHFIIWLFPECSGVPDTTPPTRAKSMKSIKTRPAISK